MGKKKYDLTTKTDSSGKTCSLSNFNGIAPLGLVLFLISIILAATALGFDRWSRQDVDRGNGVTTDSSTSKTQGLTKRCVSYTHSNEILNLNLPSEQLPQDSCLLNSKLTCSVALDYLPSAHDASDHEELQNTDSIGDCKTVRTHLLVSLSFMIIGIIVTFVAAILMCPILHRRFFLVGALCGFAGVLCYGIALGVYEASDQDFAGFFSLNGHAIEGRCIDISYGLAVGAGVINIIGILVACLAFCYKSMSRRFWSQRED